MSRNLTKHRTSCDIVYDYFYITLYRCHILYCFIVCEHTISALLVQHVQTYCIELPSGIKLGLGHFSLIMSVDNMVSPKVLGLPVGVRNDAGVSRDVLRVVLLVYYKNCWWGQCPRGHLLRPLGGPNRVLAGSKRTKIVELCGRDGEGSPR
jgi:hypothetical protein